MKGLFSFYALPFIMPLTYLGQCFLSVAPRYVTARWSTSRTNPLARNNTFVRGNLWRIGKEPTVRQACVGSPPAGLLWSRTHSRSFERTTLAVQAKKPLRGNMRRSPFGNSSVTPEGNSCRQRVGGGQKFLLSVFCLLTTWVRSNKTVQVCSFSLLLVVLCGRQPQAREAAFRSPVALPEIGALQGIDFPC